MSGKGKEDPVAKFSVWIEGYQGSGDRQLAHLLGAAEAETFADAAKAVIEEQKMNDEHWSPDKLSYWGCRLFDNESDARKSSG